MIGWKGFLLELLAPLFRGDPSEGWASTPWRGGDGVTLILCPGGP